MKIYPKSESNSITKVLNKFKMSQNRNEILVVVLKSKVAHYLKYLRNDMKHDVIMSKQCGELCVFGMMNIAPKSYNISVFNKISWNHMRKCCVVSCNSTLEILSCLNFLNVTFCRLNKVKNEWN